jgi:crotonobetainyl-CoA:carnitine CoA-transferase CaiB-like acyl-CoA transferase
MSGPLDGLLVLDFSTLLPGPMATLMLAEAGAEVIKIERPGRGDEMRSYEPRWGTDSVNFALLNRGKTSLALDLKDPTSRIVLDPLIARADVVVEQFRPGVMDRLGLGHAALSSMNPRIITCSITGYGQTGPRRDAAGHDLNYLAEAGMLSLSHGDPQRPVVPPALIADIAGGAYPAVMNILLALIRRGITGNGAHLDISMADNVFPFLYWAMGNGLAAGQWPRNGGDLVTGGTPRYRLYAAADGRTVAAAPLEQKFWESFCAAIGLEAEWQDDGRDPEGTATRVAALIASQPSAHWRAVFGAADCCCCIVATVEEALADPQFRARGLFDRVLRNADGARLPALPTPIAPGLRADPREATAPRLGSRA